MKTRASGIRWAWLATLGVGLSLGTEAKAQKGHGGHSGGHAVRAPHVSAPRQQTPRPPRMPNVMAPARKNAMPRQTGPTHVQAQVHHNRTQANKAATLAGKAHPATT